MIPAQQPPHPQRCETCGHYKDTPYYDFCDGVIMEPIGVFDWIKTHGCASHTSASSQQRIDPEQFENVFTEVMMKRLKGAGEEIAIALLQAGDGK